MLSVASPNRARASADAWPGVALALWRECENKSRHEKSGLNHTRTRVWLLWFSGVLSPQIMLMCREEKCKRNLRGCFNKGKGQKRMCQRCDCSLSSLSSQTPEVQSFKRDVKSPWRHSEVQQSAHCRAGNVSTDGCTRINRNTEYWVNSILCHSVSHGGWCRLKWFSSNEENWLVWLM